MLFASHVYLLLEHKVNKQSLLHSELVDVKLEGDNNNITTEKILLAWELLNRFQQTKPDLNFADFMIFLRD